MPDINIGANWRLNVHNAYSGSVNPLGAESDQNAPIKLKNIMGKSKDAGSLSTKNVLSTYALVYSNSSGAYTGGVLAMDGSVHLVPYVANRGQKINPNGTVSTYSLVYTNTSGAYVGGVLAADGSIHFVPHTADRGQKIAPDGTVSTYSLVYTNSEGAFAGGAISPDGTIHFVPARADRGQKISPSGTVSTYSLVRTDLFDVEFGSAAFRFYGAVLDTAGSVHFVPSAAHYGQKVSSTGTVSTYALAYEGDQSSYCDQSELYAGGVLGPDGSVHFVPARGFVGQKVSPSGTVSTYSLAKSVAKDPVDAIYEGSDPTVKKYVGGVLAPDGSIHFIPFQSDVGQKVSPDGTTSTYALAHVAPVNDAFGYNPTPSYAGGVLMPDGTIQFIDFKLGKGGKIFANCYLPFDPGFCLSPYLNKL